MVWEQLKADKRRTQEEKISLPLSAARKGLTACEENIRYISCGEFSESFNKKNKGILINLLLKKAEALIPNLEGRVESWLDEGWSLDIKSFLRRLPEVLRLRKQNEWESYKDLNLDEITPQLGQLAKEFEPLLKASAEIAEGWWSQIKALMDREGVNKEEWERTVTKFLEDKEGANSFIEALKKNWLLKELEERLKKRFKELAPVMEERRIRKREIEDLTATLQQPIEISDEELNRGLKREIGERVRNTCLNVWGIRSDILSIFPRCLFVLNPQVNEDKLSRGFGGSISTEKQTGSLFLYFPEGQGKIKNLSLEKIEPDKDKEGFYVETYKITEEKADGSLETYQMRVDYSGVTFACGDGTITHVPFGEPKTLISTVRKPVIYFYSKKKRKIKLKLDFKGKIGFVYPKPQKFLTWELEVEGEKISYKRKQYPYLFWDGQYKISGVNFKEGFVVKGKELNVFLEDKLTYLGLNQKEITDFVTYWVPFFQDAPWVYIKFDKDVYKKIANLEITPSPDKIIRVFALFKKLKRKIAIKPQKLFKENALGREKLNFLVVDWGGVIV